MEILGVGVPEIAFIVLIALILLGPKDMVAAGRTIGRVLRSFLTSPTWLAMRKTGEELQKLPTKLVREANLEELQKEVQSVTNQIKPVAIRKTFDEAMTFSPSTPPILPNEPPKPASIPETSEGSSSEPPAGSESPTKPEA